MSVTNTKKHDGDFWATPVVVKEALSELIKNKNITAIDPCYGTGGTEIEGVNYVAKYDIIDYGMKDVTLKSFLDVEPYKVDAVIMNPNNEIFFDNNLYKERFCYGYSVNLKKVINLDITDVNR